MPDSFHFLRPEWFIAVPFVIALLLLLLRRSSQNSGWEEICDPALLQYQLRQKGSVTAKKQTVSMRLFNRTVPFLLPLIFLIGIFSLAGPSWEKKDQPVFQQGNALVIVLDLSLSMNAQDLKPSRLERAKLKLIDILQQKKEGQTALIAFAGDAHVVSPLTIDNKTIMSLLPALESSIMPLSGSHLIDALASAKQLFKSAGFAHGDVLLLSDGIDSSQQSALQKSIKKLHQQGYRFSVIGVGSQAGSPIPMPGQGGFIKDQTGQVVLSKLEPAPLKKLAAIGGGAYYKLSLDDSDFDQLLDQQLDQDNGLTDQDKQLEQWVDAGAYFTLLLIPLALLSFRKGLLSLIVCVSIAFSFVTDPVYADTGAADTQSDKQLKKHWQELWATPDQQGQKSFNAKDYQTAADNFSDNKWKASAYYRAGNYEKALQQYTQSDDADSLYNKGNTLANMNQFQEAIEAYEQALKKAPETNQTLKKNAHKNLEYLNELLAQQKNQSSENNSDKKNENSEQQSEDQDQQSQSDDSSKSDNSESDKSEQNNSEQSKSEGSDSEEKEQQSSDAENNENNDSNNTTQENQEEASEPRSPDEAKPAQQQEKNPQDDAKQMAESEPEEDESNQENADSTPTNDVLSQLSQEEQQSLKQWLQRIPDNPGELLRIKFRNNTLLKQRQSGSTDAQYEGNPW